MSYANGFLEFLNDINCDGKLPRDVVRLLSRGRMVYKDRVALAAFCIQNAFLPSELWCMMMEKNPNCTEAKRKAFVALYNDISVREDWQCHYIAHDIYSGKMLCLRKHAPHSFEPLPHTGTVPSAIDGSVCCAASSVEPPKRSDTPPSSTEDDFLQDIKSMIEEESLLEADLAGRECSTPLKKRKLHFVQL